MSDRESTSIPGAAADITGYNTGLAGGPATRETTKVGPGQAADAFRLADGGTTCEGPVVDPDTGEEKHLPNG